MLIAVPPVPVYQPVLVINEEVSESSRALVRTISSIQEPVVLRHDSVTAMVNIGATAEQGFQVRCPRCSYHLISVSSCRDTLIVPPCVYAHLIVPQLTAFLGYVSLLPLFLPLQPQKNAFRRLTSQKSLKGVMASVNEDEQAQPAPGRSGVSASAAADPLTSISNRQPQEKAGADAERVPEAENRRPKPRFLMTPSRKLFESRLQKELKTETILRRITILMDTR